MDLHEDKHGIDETQHQTSAEMKPESRIVHKEHAAGFETAADELPPHYYRSLYFLGTMVACGASFGSVCRAPVDQAIRMD